VQCLSNLRQISAGTAMFAAENRGYMPAIGTDRLYWLDTYTGKFTQIFVDDDPHIQTLANWICWNRLKDPVTGKMSTAPNLNITYSGLAKYLGAKLRVTATPDESNRANAVLDAVFRCPSDNLQQRPSTQDDSHGYYRYSYSMNSNFVNPVSGTGRTLYDGKFTGKFSSIRKPSEKILYICQDEKTLDDGSYTASPTRWKSSSTSLLDLVASRHEPKQKKARNRENTAEINEDARGNVAFVDGHGAFMSRKDALRQRHSGNVSTADPDDP
jgi:prepilin-type processing-associated H-X9-DG protein